MLPGKTEFRIPLEFFANPGANPISDQVANLRSADLNVESREQIKRRGVSSGIAKLERVDPNRIAGNRLRCRLCAGGSFHGQAMRQGCPQVVQRLTGARGDDQWSGKGDLRRQMPAPQTEKRIRAHQAKQRSARRQLCAKKLQGFQRVVGCGGGFGRVDQRNLKACSPFDRETRHLHAVVKTGRGPHRLERLRAYWSKEHRIQSQRRAGCARHRQVTLMRRVKTASEEGDAPAGMYGLSHQSIVSCAVTVSALPPAPSASIKTMRTLIAVLALAGVVVSALALQVHYSTATEPCDINAKWDCGIVNHSPFAEILHVPVAALGIAGYLGMAGLALARRERLLAALALGALGFSLYLTYIEKYVLEVYCIYCVTSLGIIFLITALSFWWAISDWRATRPA